MRKIREYFEFSLIFLYYKFCEIIGLNFSSFFSGFILSLFGIFSLKNKIAHRNLKKTFPELTFFKRKKIIYKMWFHFGRVIGEYPHLKNIKIFNNPKIKIVGLNNLLSALKNNNNCLFFSAHIGNWELTSHPLTKSGFNISFIYRAPNNMLVDQLLRKIRSSYGVGLIKKGPSGAKECIKILNKSNGHLGMLIDQKMNDGIDSMFFNHKVKTASAIAKFSLKYKCPIIPAFCIRDKGTNFTIEYLSPINYFDLKKFKTEKQIMNHLNLNVESWIKKKPEQWIWIHNRF